MISSLEDSINLINAADKDLVLACSGALIARRPELAAYLNARESSVKGLYDFECQGLDGSELSECEEFVAGFMAAWEMK